MVDSVGVRSSEDFKCILCAKRLRVITYTPIHRHDGRKIDFGTFFDEILGVDGSYDSVLNFFIINSDGQGKFRFEKFPLKISRGPYVPDDIPYEFPKSEFDAGKLVWVCPSCMDITGGSMENIVKCIVEKLEMYFSIFQEKKDYNKPSFEITGYFIIDFYVKNSK